MAKKKFGGRLDEPMIPKYKSLLSAEMHHDYFQLEREKLIELAEYYGCPKGDYFSLSLALAREFVQGFQAPKRRRGRKIKWNEFTLGILFVEIQRNIKKMDLPGRPPITEAAKVIAKQQHWAKFIDACSSDGIDPNPTETIRQAYYKAEKAKFSQVLWEGFLYKQLTENIAEWDSLVRDILANPPIE